VNSVNLKESEFKMSALQYIVVGSTESFFGSQSAPLQQVSVTGFLRDTVAEYTLVQTYVNPLQDATIEAAYTFPLYEGVAVSGFEAEVDGRKIVGKVQEKVAARKEYDDAVKEGKVASLLEQERPDVFQASIGNIPPAKTISIRLTLVSEIKQDADENQVRFVLPTTIAPRYGRGAPDVSSTSKSSTSTLSVDISCAMAKPITSIQSPSHTIQVHLGTTPTRVSLTADSLLDRDLVIIVQAPGLDAPRAVVERHPRDGTHAVSLTFSPRFALNPLKSTELVFLVDRSGSMSGSKIKQAGEALELFLRSIPSDDHYINIVGFGSTHQALFPKSVEYSADSLKQSTKYAKALEADMGGTEITSAVQEVFQRRRRDVPTQVFLLTDGEVWDVDTLVQCIKDAVAEGEKTNSFVRVFSLGVGASVSHHLIESVARAGGGYAQLVVEGERMEKKVVNLLKSALMPPVTNVGIQWTTEDAHVEDDYEMVEVVEEDSQPKDIVQEPSKEPISLYSTDPEVPSPPPPPPSVLPEVVIPIQQTPFKVPALYRGARFTINAILSPETTVPKELVLRGSSADGPVELKVPVETVREGETVLHALAARSLVRDLEGGASYIHALGGGGSTATNEQMLRRLGVHVKKQKSLPLSDKIVSELAKQKMLELALKYQLSSKLTSWVAIDTETNQSIVHDKVPDAPMAEFCYAQPVSKMALPVRSGMFGGSRSGGGGSRGVMFGAASCAPQAPQRMFSPSYISSDSAPQAPSFMLAGSRRRVKKPNQGIMDQLMAVKASAPPPPASAPILFGSHAAPAASTEGSKEEECSNTADPHARLHSLLQHQQFDGSFPLVPAIAALFSTTVDELKAKLGEVRKDHQVPLSETEWETLWATCLAVEYLKKQLADLQEEWELVVEKAEKRAAAMVKSAKGVVAAIQQAASEVMKTNTA